MTSRTLSTLLLMAALLAVAAVADAQDTPRVGITMGYPAAIGVIWNIGDRVAVRPEMTISGSSGDSSGVDASGVSPGFNTDAFSIGAGLSGLFYLKRWDLLRTYVSPRFSYSYASNTSNRPSSTAIISSSSDATSKAYTTSGSFGAEYSLGRRFGVFGEIGLAYTSTTASSASTLVTTLTTGGIFGPVTTTTTTTTVGSTSHSKSWAARSGAGVIVYF